MRRNELIELRRLVTEEQNRRERINQLLANQLVQEYLEKTNTDPVDLDEDNVREIIQQILKDFKIKMTNDIYVCTSSYCVEWSVSYEDTNYYTSYEDINSPYAEYKTYQDIEDGRIVRAATEKEKQKRNQYPSMKEFEREHIVLNPTNKNRNSNGYKDVRLDFFQTAVESGQAKSKRLLLEKYPRL